MSHPIPSTVRANDLLRHLQDLRSSTYEGAMSRGAKEVVYRQVSTCSGQSPWRS